MEIRAKHHRFPFCIVWTPIPVITWLCPFIGHMGIATSKGVIRDFAGSYLITEDEMAFGWPTLYKQLSPEFVAGGADRWDQAVIEATEEYHTRVHNLICDNCHSYVALALNRMKYKNRDDWNMLRVGLLVLAGGRFVGFGGFLKQYLPTFLLALIVLTFIFLFL